MLLSGSVYNKSELLQPYNINTQTANPELIASLFLQEGHGFVKKLNGDFALLIMQPEKKESYLFRDNLGIRSLAWVRDRQTLFFMTDITCLCRAFTDGHTIDSEYLLSYFKYIDYRKTPNERIKKLPPGHFLHFSESGVDIAPYWEPEKIRVDRRLPFEKMISDLKDIVWDAVRIRCDRRFTAGAHVSSGIDSGIVSTLARKEYQHQEIFNGFSWSPANYVTGEVKYDERKIVATFSGQTNIRPVFSDLDETNFPRLVANYYNNQGYFFEDMTVEQAVAAGTNLIFSGWGGDEFISTGHSGIDLDLLFGLQFRTFFRRNPIDKPQKFVKRMFFYVIYPALGILDRGTAKSFRNDARYIKKSYRKSDRKALGNFYFHFSRRQMHLNTLSFYNIQERCESWNMLGFRKGVEYRYPLLDKRIIEYMLKVPSELLCRTGQFRPLLREISQGILPEEVRLNQSKNDPVCWAYMDELHKTSAVSFMEEVNIWKANPDLHFVDFDLLTEDISKFKSQTLDIDNKILFRALVYLKAIHEFTVIYRQHGVDGEILRGSDGVT